MYEFFLLVSKWFFFEAAHAGIKSSADSISITNVVLLRKVLFIRKNSAGFKKQ